MAAFSDGDKVKILKGKFLGKAGEVVSFRVKRSDGSVESYEGASIEPWTDPVPVTRLTLKPDPANKTRAILDEVPAGVTHVRGARSDSPTGGTTDYDPVPGKPVDGWSYEGTVAKPFVGAQGYAAGKAVTEWADPRAKTEHTTVPPVDPPPDLPPDGVLMGWCMRNWEAEDRAAWTTVKPKAGTFVRYEFGNNTDATRWLNFYSGLGATPLPLWGFDSIPADGQIVDVANWIKANKGRFPYLEVGNELSYSYKNKDAGYAKAYARVIKRLAELIAGSGVGLLAINDDANSGSWWWVDAMYEEVPDIHKSVAMWTVHPYQPGSEARVRAAIAAAAKHGGGAIPVACTETGMACDPGRTLDDAYYWAKNRTDTQAAADLTTHVGKLVPAGAKMVIIYQSTDQKPPGAESGRERYFGVCRAGGTSKGALTAAARELLT